MAEFSKDTGLYEDEEEMKLSAMKRVLKASAKALRDPLFLQKCMDEFMREKIIKFPKLCNEVRRVNFLKRKADADSGNPGGWSDKKDFKFDYTIPKEIYNFMINLVARDFWDESNEKHWRAFMEGIIKGEDSNFLLYRAKMAFDGNAESDKIKVTN